MAVTSPFVGVIRKAADAFATGQLGEGGEQVVDVLDEHPEAVLDVLDLLFAEAAKKRPNQKRLSGYAWLLGHGLEFIRYRCERKLDEGLRLADAVRKKILDVGGERLPDPGILALVLGQFTRAKLAIGDELRDMMAISANRFEDPAPGAGVNDLSDQLGEMARLCDGDPFLLYGQLAEMSGAFPIEHRMIMAITMLGSAEATARDAALGWLFDDEAQVRIATGEALAQAAEAGALSGVALRRMITLRNWLPEGERASLDRAIKSCRQRGVACAPWPGATYEAAFASGIDGSGAQSFCLLMKTKRKFDLSLFLMKHGVGFRDAFVLKGLTKTDVSDILAQASGAAGLYPSSAEHVSTSIRHGLAVTGEQGAMPPFALLDAVETAGISEITPARLDLDGIVTALCAEADGGAPTPAAIQDMLDGSADWIEVFAFPETWFDADGAVEALLFANPGSPDEQAALVLERWLPQRRRYWAEICAWSALTLKVCTPDAAWLPFAFVARELLAGADLTRIPIMVDIADATVEACQPPKPAPPRRRKRA
jgi:hypothetical protein